MRVHWQTAGCRFSSVLFIKQCLSISFPMTSEKCTVSLAEHSVYIVFLLPFIAFSFILSACDGGQICAAGCTCGSQRTT